MPETSKVIAPAALLGDADRQHEHDGGYEHVAAFLEVDVVFDEIAHADGRDHAVEHERHAANHTRRHSANHGGEFRTE